MDFFDITVFGIPIIELIGHIIGFIGVASIFASYQFKEKKTIMIGQTVGSACISLQFLLIGDPTAFALNAVCLLRNLIFNIKHRLGKLGALSPYFFAVVMVAVSVLMWNGPITLLMMSGLAINTVCLGICKPQGLRASLLLTCVLVLIYDLFAGSVSGALNEVLSIISATVGLIRYHRVSPNASEDKND